MAKIINIKDYKEKKILYGYLMSLEEDNDLEIEDYRKTEISWIAQYNIEDSSNTIILKGLELLQPALLKNALSDDVKSIIDVLYQEILNLCDITVGEKDTKIHSKIIKKHNTLTHKEFLEYLINSFDSWSDEIKRAVAQDDKNLMANALAYIVGLETTIVSILIEEA